MTMQPPPSEDAVVEPARAEILLPASTSAMAIDESAAHSANEPTQSSVPEVMPKVWFYKGIIKNYPADHIRQAVINEIKAGEDYAFHITSMHAVEEAVNWWKTCMDFGGRNKLHLHYAVKSNPSPAIIERMVRDPEAGYDCASAYEMQLCLEKGADPSQIVFSNPCKLKSDIKFAVQHDVEITTFDSISELEKLAQLWPNCKAMMRIETINKYAKVNLSEKYGAPERIWDSLISKASELGINVVGVMFHAGSEAEKPPIEPLTQTVDQTVKALDMMKKAGFNPYIVDWGGGWNFEFTNTYQTVIPKLMEKLPDYITHMYGEPGRSISKRTQVWCVKVMGVHDGALITTDGSYGGFQTMREYYSLKVCAPIDHTGAKYQGPLKHVNLFGPTCSSFDKFATAFAVPADIKVEDWLVFNGMGSYSRAKSTDFNGIPKSREVVIEGAPTRTETEDAEHHAHHKIDMSEHQAMVEHHAKVDMLHKIATFNEDGDHHTAHQHHHSNHAAHYCATLRSSARELEKHTEPVTTHTLMV